MDPCRGQGSQLAGATAAIGDQVSAISSGLAIDGSPGRRDSPDGQPEEAALRLFARVLGGAATPPAPAGMTPSTAS